VFQKQQGDKSGHEKFCFQFIWPSFAGNEVKWFRNITIADMIEPLKWV